MTKNSFGDELNVSDDQPFKFSEKELDKMYGLDWYDFGVTSNKAILG